LIATLLSQIAADVHLPEKFSLSAIFFVITRQSNASFPIDSSRQGKRSGFTKKMKPIENDREAPPLSSGHPQALLSAESMGALTSREFPRSTTEKPLWIRKGATQPVE
jgi:hypothetical protein